MRSLISRFALPLAIAFSAPLTVACGSDDDDGGSSSGGAGGTSGSGGSGGMTSMNILETAEAAGNFTTLAAAVEAAGLEDTLNGPGPFTVFAPPDSAFEGLPAGTVDTLLMPENKDQLTAILTYHVVSGEVKAEQVVTLTSATTVNGADIAIKVDGGDVILNDTVTVTQTDIEASNGVIHVIDGVLLPPEE